MPPVPAPFDVYSLPLSGLGFVAPSNTTENIIYVFLYLVSQVLWKLCIVAGPRNP